MIFQNCSQMKMVSREAEIIKSYKEILSKIKKEGVYDLIIVEGVVGVGKTTLMELLVAKGYIPFREPVVDNPILDKFYYDRKRYSFPLQVFFLNKRFEHIKKAENVENAVMDRSIYGDAIFAKLLHSNNEMSDEEHDIYVELLENMLEHVKKPKLIIYLESSVESAIKKINQRGRDYEQKVEEEYWVNLNKEYSDYFSQYELSPILKINVDNLDFKNNAFDQEYVMDLIESKLLEIEE